jgi:hypothetical protein
MTDMLRSPVNPYRAQLDMGAKGVILMRGRSINNGSSGLMKASLHDDGDDDDDDKPFCVIGNLITKSFQSQTTIVSAALNVAFGSLASEPPDVEHFPRLQINTTASRIHWQSRMWTGQVSGLSSFPAHLALSYE